MRESPRRKEVRGSFWRCWGGCIKDWRRCIPQPPTGWRGGGDGEEASGEVTLNSYDIVTARGELLGMLYERVLKKGSGDVREVFAQW